MATRILLYTRTDCHLCEKVKDLLESLKSEYNIQIQEIDISQDAELEKKYGDIIPVLDFPGGILLYGVIRKSQIRNALEERAEQ